MKKIQIVQKLGFFFFLLFLAVFPLQLAYAQEEQEGKPHVKIGIDEKLGETIPLDLSFTNEMGEVKRLSEVIYKPTVLALVYYHCPGICSPMLMGLADVVDRSAIEPGKDYNIVTISFDPSETPKHAKVWKDERLTTLRRTVPSEAWSFMTGDSESIKKLTNSVGFYYQPDRDSTYAHMSSLIMLSPKGKITRYILGTRFNTADLEMAVINARQEQTMPTLNKILAFCFSYERQGDKYVLNITRVIGTIVLFMVTVVFAVLTIKGRKKKNK